MRFVQRPAKLGSNISIIWLF